MPMRLWRSDAARRSRREALQEADSFARQNADFDHLVFGSVLVGLTLVIRVPEGAWSDHFSAARVGSLVLVAVAVVVSALLCAKLGKRMGPKGMYFFASWLCNSNERKHTEYQVSRESGLVVSHL